MRTCPHGFEHPDPFNPRYPHSCDGCWCEGFRDRSEYGWPHDTTPLTERREGGGMTELHTRELVERAINEPNIDGAEAQAVERERILIGIGLNIADRLDRIADALDAKVTAR